MESIDNLKKLSYIPVPRAGEIMNDDFSYPNYVKEYLSSDDFLLRRYDKMRGINVFLDNNYVDYLFEIQDLYFHDYMRYGSDVTDVYSEEMKKITLEYIFGDYLCYCKYIGDDGTLKSLVDSFDMYKYESFDRALGYYNGELKLSDLYLEDLSAPIINGLQSMRLYMLKRYIISRLDYLDEEMFKTYKIGDILRGNKK